MGATLKTASTGLALAMLAAASCAALANEPATNASVPASTSPGPSMSGSGASAPFIAPSFQVPTLVKAPGFTLMPLGPKLVKVDFAAYMSSIEHLQATFTRSTAWPHRNLSDADAMLDMETEQGRFQRRESFAYAVLTPDGSRERGSVYVRPSTVKGYDAEVSMWVTKAEYDAGFDAELYAWVKSWIAQDWPFKNVAYPGRAIAWSEWDAAVAASKAAQ